jgi:lipoprotein-releasing system ATP-binding protein
MQSEPALRCHDIERYLGEDEERVHALRGISLNLEQGTVHAVVGPSGCGKSTLLYILGLLDHPDAGEVIIEGERVSNLPEDASHKNGISCSGSSSSSIFSWKISPLRKTS